MWTRSKFFEKFDENRNFSKILLKSTFFEIFEKFQQNRNLSKIWPKSKFFELFE